MAVYESEREAYQCQLQAHLAQKRNRRTAVSTQASAEGTGWDGGIPAPPVCTRYLINEATIETVHVILKENPQGGAVPAERAERVAGRGSRRTNPLGGAEARQAVERSTTCLSRAARCSI